MQLSFKTLTAVAFSITLYNIFNFNVEAFLLVIIGLSIHELTLVYYDWIENMVAFFEAYYDWK